MLDKHSNQEANMKKSINLYSFPKEYSIEQCFDKALAAGFGAVEPNFELTGPLGFDSNDKSVLSVKRMADDRGLELASLSTILYWGAPPTSGDPAIRSRAMDLIRRHLEIASLLGVGTILLVPGVLSSDTLPGVTVQYDTAYDRAPEFVSAALAHAKACGVVIGIENVANKMLLSPMEMRAFIDSCGSPFVKAYFDIGNIMPYGFPEHWIRILGSRIVRLHVKDYRFIPGTGGGYSADLLTGEVNFPEVMKAIREVGYDGFITVELGSYRHCSDQSVDNAAASLGRILSL